MLSKLVSSNQKEVHPDLEVVLKKHLSAEYKKPISDYTKEAFDSVSAKLANAKIILDSG